MSDTRGKFGLENVTTRQRLPESWSGLSFICVLSCRHTVPNPFGQRINVTALTIHTVCQLLSKDPTIPWTDITLGLSTCQSICQNQATKTRTGRKGKIVYAKDICHRFG